MSDDEVKLAIRESTKFPLTARTKLAYDYQDHLDKEWDNVKKCKLLGAQTKGINSIKEHIAQRKKAFLCHQYERAKTGVRRQQELEKIILSKHKISLQNENTRKRIAEKLLEYNKTEKMKMQRQKDRMIKIIQRISGDFEWKDQAGIEKGPTWKPRKKLPPEPVIEEEEELQIEEVKEEQEWEDLKPEKEKNGKKDTKDIEDKKDKNSEKSKENKEDKKSKDSKDTKSSTEGKKGGKEVFIMPEVPITNPREKIKSDETEKMEDLLKPLHEYDKFFEEENEYYRKKAPYPIIKTVASRPPEVLFKDFENNKGYKQKLHIHNNGAEIINCKYHNIICVDEFESTCILVEDVGIQKVLPGRFYPLTIYFYPKELNHLEGELIFTTYRPGKQDIKQFSVPFKCVMASINIKVSPTNITFKSLPIWEVQNASSTNYKTIEIQNNMIKECILIIRRAKNKILDDEDNEKLDNETKVRSSQQVQFSTKQSSLNNTIELFINECFDQISHIFQFTSYFYSIPPKSILNVKIFWKNGPFVGAHQEIFDFEFVERVNNEFNILQCESVLVQGEITGKFITMDYEYIDYNICVLNHVYQQPFNVYNNGSSPVKIGFQYPSKLKQYFSAYPQTFFLKPYNHEYVSLRFFPRKEIISSEIKYYDPGTNILNCPIKICILSTKPTRIPPSILTVYAILSEPDGIKLRLRSQDTLEEDGCPVINMGLVTTHEAVVADFEIENISSVTQEFGFINLPSVMTVRPDYGFGIIEPHETKKIEICLSPTNFDLITDELVHSSGPLDVSYKICCTTAYKLGSICRKKTDENKFDKHKREYLESKFNKEYLENIDELFATTNFNDSESTIILNSNPVSDKMNEVETHEINQQVQEDETVEEEENKIEKNLRIIIKATLIDYWTELSHQYVIFPDTPLGSYTTMNILFSTVNNTTFDECVCGFVRKESVTNYECHFELTGGCKDITIEPICGNLKKGEKVHLLLTAKPSVENQILTQTAKICKVQRLATAKPQKGKGGKEKPVKENKNRESDKDALDKISVHNCDYYPAEKEIAKSMRPYTITTKFTFVVSFPEYLNKANEILYITAECKVIRPDFITSLQTQYINFGPTVILTRPKIVINLENISRGIIQPKISPLSPIGPFICTTQIQNNVEKEHILKIPITFAPDEEIYYKEYFEIKSGNTTETLMVSGEGVEAQFEFAPKFKVSRIEAKFGKSTDCVFQVNNNCRAPLQLYLIKICELKGTIQPKPIEKEENTAGKKDKTAGKNKKEKSAKPKKFSEDLSPDEEYSLEKFFAPYEGESQFKIMNAINDSVIEVEGMTKLKVKIRFETPKPPPDPETEGKGSGKDKKSKSSDKSSKVSGKAEKGVKFAAKYNVMLGNIVLVNDFIILAEFK